MTNDEEPRQNSWQIDKRIPISMFGLGLVQIIVLCGWAFSLQSRVIFIEGTYVTKESYAVISEKMNAMAITIDKLDRKMETMGEDIRKLSVHGK